VRLKDPTAWMEDLTVFVEDEEIRETAALLEPDLIYRGSRIGAALWLSLVGTASGAFAALALSAGVRSSIWAFAAYLAAGVILLRGLRPATERLLGRPIVWFARTTFFWAVLIACMAVLTAGFRSGWLAYGLSAAGGFFIGMMHGSLNPNCVKREDAWMGAALALGTFSTILGTALERMQSGEPSLGGAAMVGAVAAGLFSAPMSALLFRLWDEAHGCRQMAMLFLHNDSFAAKAVSYLDHAIALSPGDPELHNLRGVAWSKMGDSARAAEDWRKAADLAPFDSGPYMNIGVDHLRRGALAEAIEAFGTALERDPDDPTLHSNLGTARQRRGELDKAIAHYDKAIALRPDYANAYSNRAYARHLKGDHQGAIEDCDRALELNDRLSSALANRAHALAALKDYGAASACYRGALEMGASPELREEILQGLQALSKAHAAELSPA
jgi:Flp pilus assembly protein TadD